MTAHAKTGPSTLHVALIVVAILGAAAAGFLVGRHTHVLDRRAAIEAEVDTLLARAEAALHEERFDEPRGENVLELTDAARAHAPADHRIVELRQRASDRLVRRGLARRAQGDAHGAYRDFELAARLARPDHGLLDLLDELRASGAASTSPELVPRR